MMKANKADSCGKVLHVTDYDLLYQVNDKGRQWVPGQRVQTKPPSYVRQYVHGPKGNNIAFLEVAIAIRETFGDDRWPVAWALFEKLLEVATDQRGNRRGYLLGKGGSQISRLMLAHLTGFTEQQIENGITALLHACCGWLEEVETPDFGDDPGLPRGAPGNPGESRVSRAEASGAEKSRDEGSRDSPDASGSADFSQKSESAEATDSPTVEVVGEAEHANQVKRLAELLGSKLKVSTANRRQFNLDAKAIFDIARDIIVGALGDPLIIEPRALAKAQQLGASSKIKKPIAAFRAWVGRGCPAPRALRR